jgi:NADH:ubiquinone oxidoreductase subunit E
MFDLKKAELELSKNTIQQIEQQTAYTWASRSWVAYSNFMKTKDFRWFEDAEQYYLEACEHAACYTKDALSLLKEIKEKLDPIKKDAELIVRKKSFV